MQSREQYNQLVVEVGSNQFEAAEALLMAGISPNIEDKDIDTCLHFAVINNNLPMVGLLIHYKADLHRLNKDKKTALDLAAEAGRWDIAQLLIDADQAQAASLNHVVLLAAVRARQVSAIRGSNPPPAMSLSREDWC